MLTRMDFQLTLINVYKVVYTIHYQYCAQNKNQLTIT